MNSEQFKSELNLAGSSRRQIKRELASLGINVPLLSDFDINKYKQNQKQQVIVLLIKFDILTKMIKQITKDWRQWESEHKTDQQKIRQHFQDNQLKLVKG